MKPKNLTGKKYGRLTPIKIVGTNKYRHKVWLCRCDCGSKYTVPSNSLQSGATKSCGCLARDVLIKRNKEMMTHGMFGTKEYGTWSRMKQRCEDVGCAAYIRYGAKGIRVYEPWSKSFIAFYKYIGKSPSKAHSIDRIDNKGNYEPGNVRWATWREQANNRSSSRYIHYNGTSMTVIEWARERGINYNTLLSRLNRSHWTIGEALEYEKRD